MNFNFKNLKLGSLVEIEIMNRQNEIIKLKTIVEEILDESTMRLFAPVQNGVQYPIKERQSFNLVAIFKYPTVDKYDILACRCKMISRQRIENISTITVSKTTVFKQIQRRNYFRLPLIKTIPVMQNGIKYELLSKDLSGNGVKGYISKKLDLNEEAILMLDIESKVLELRMKVLECAPDPEHSYRYEMRGNFANIKNTQSSQLLKYIFSKQSEAIRKQIDLKAYVSILDSDLNYSDFFSISTLEKTIRVTPIFLWALTMIQLAYLTNAFREDNMGLNFFFGEFTRQFKPELLSTANSIALITLMLIIISGTANNFYNKKTRGRLNIHFTIQALIALVTIIIYFLNY